MGYLHAIPSAITGHSTSFWGHSEGHSEGPWHPDRRAVESPGADQHREKQEPWVGDVKIKTLEFQACCREVEAQRVEEERKNKMQETSRLEDLLTKTLNRVNDLENAMEKKEKRETTGERNCSRWEEPQETCTCSFYYSFRDGCRRSSRWWWWFRIRWWEYVLDYPWRNNSSFDYIYSMRCHVCDLSISVFENCESSTLNPYGYPPIPFLCVYIYIIYIYIYI